MRRPLSLVLAASLALASAPTAWAANEADAKDLFAKGRALRAKGDCAGAVPLFEKAFQLYPEGLGSLRNLAECEEQLGKFASARRRWLDLKRGLLVTHDAKYAGWDEDAEQAAARLAPKVAQLVLDVRERGPEGENPIGEGSPLVVLVNGERIDPKLLDVPLDRDPGSYVVRIEGGKDVVEAKVTVAAGESKSVKLVAVLPESTLPKKVEKQESLPEAPPEARDTGSTTRTIGWIALGVGAAGVVGTAIGIGIRQSALSELSDACPAYESGRCANPAAETAEDRGKAGAMMANVFGGVAIVGLGVGIGLLVAGAKPDAPKAAGVKLSPWASAQGGGATLWGAF